MATRTANPPTGARDRLVEAAGKIFSERGYHGATVREITQEAGVNLAAINYYFRDKEELYWAVLQHAAQSALKRDAPPSPDLSPSENLKFFIAEFLRHMLDPARPEWHGRLIARELASPTRLLDILVESNVRPRSDALRHILRDLLNYMPDEEEEALLCSSIMGQCLYFRQNKAVFDRLYPKILTGKNTIDKLARHITDFSLAALSGLNKNHSSKS